MVGGDLPAFDDDLWELYDGTSDFSQAHDLAAENPEMLAKLQRLWIIEATKYNVLPIDDRGAERLNPDLAGRPTLIHGTSQQFFPGMGGSPRTACSASRTSRSRSRPTSTSPTEASRA